MAREQYLLYEVNPLRKVRNTYEPRCEKDGLRGFRPGPTQTVQLQKMARGRGLKFGI